MAKSIPRGRSGPCPERAQRVAGAVRPRTCHPPVELHAMTTTRELAIPIPHEEIAAFCRKWGIKRLSFFGSIVRDDFDPQRSDVDVLVEFKPGQTPGWAIVSAEDELAKMFRRKVDLRTEQELSRWMIKDVLSEAVDEYVEPR